MGDGTNSNLRVTRTLVSYITSIPFWSITHSIVDLCGEYPSAEICPLSLGGVQLSLEIAGHVCDLSLADGCVLLLASSMLLKAVAPWPRTAILPTGHCAAWYWWVSARATYS